MPLTEHSTGIVFERKLVDRNCSATEKLRFGTVVPKRESAPERLTSASHGSLVISMAYAKTQ
jgi:hypothetical protein